MELRHIRYFLAVAEESHFTRAAAKLGIGQPPLSQQILDLETEIGARLFHRVPHGAELTEAGTAFRQAVQTIPAQVAAAVRQAQKASRGETGALRIGFTATAMFNPVMPNAIRAFRRAFPDVDLTLEEGNSTALALAIIDGRLDIACLRPEAITDPRLKIFPLPDEALVAALPAGHPLATSARPLHLPDLRTSPFVITPRDIGAGFFDAVVDACRAAGFDPIIGQPAPQISSMLSLVAAEFGVALVPASMRQFAVTGVVLRDLADAAPTARLAMTFAKANPSASLRNFLNLYRASDV